MCHDFSGRSETEVEYDVGFDEEGKVSALSVRGWWLAGADLDLAWNDMMIIQTGADQVGYRLENAARLLISEMPLGQPASFPSHPNEDKAQRLWQDAIP